MIYKRCNIILCVPILDCNIVKQLKTNFIRQGIQREKLLAWMQKAISNEFLCMKDINIE